MKVHRVLRHGERLRPEYLPATGQDEGWAGKSTAEERPDGQVTGIVRRFSPKECAASEAVDLGLTRSAHANAMDMSARLTGTAGLASLAGLFSACMGWFFLDRLVLDHWRAPAFGASEMVFLVVGLFLLFISQWIFLRPLRLELFRARNEGTLFDRKRRKVYRLFKDARSGLLGLFKPWPVLCCEYDWDLLDAEHNANLVTSGSTVSRQHHLVFIVRRSADDPTIIDSFNVGNALILGETTVAPLYEHIRRYMEEGGPAFAGGVTREPAPEEQNFLEQVGFHKPYVREYLRWWGKNLPFMLLFHALFPITVPLALIFAFFNWLARRTAIELEWPKEVLDAIGPPLVGEELQRQEQAAAQRMEKRRWLPAPQAQKADTAAVAAPAAWVARAKPVLTEAPLAVHTLNHAGGLLKLKHKPSSKRAIRYVVVDAKQSVHRGLLDAAGAADLIDLPAGELSIAYFPGPRK